MLKVTHIFRPTIARRIPDPVFKKEFGTERHIFVMNVKDIPLDIGTDPNARNPNINKQVYKVVENSLLNRQEGSEPNSFHLKNKGITIIAKSVEQTGENVYSVAFDNHNHGIVDGGHTYALISKHIKENDLPENQFVSVEIRTGIQQHWVQDISGGLNTGVQVQAMSLDNLAGLFGKIKDELCKSGFDKKVAWSENDEGEINARDIISIMLCFNIEIYPNTGTDHPVEAYTSKAAALKKFEDKTDSFNRMTPIIKDILFLYDEVCYGAGIIWNEGKGKGGSNSKGVAGKLAWMDYSGDKKQYKSLFANKSSKYKLLNGALYPIIAAFRWYVEIGPDLKMRWKIPFKEVMASWNENSLQMLRATSEMCDELGKNPNALGKNKSNWGNQANIVKAHYYEFKSK